MSLASCPECNQSDVPTRYDDDGQLVLAYHDWPPMCRRVCPGSLRHPDPTGCPACGSDDYFELDAEGGDPDLQGVKRCEECGEEWA